MIPEESGGYCGVYHFTNRANVTHLNVQKPFSKLQKLKAADFGCVKRKRHVKECGGGRGVSVGKKDHVTRGVSYKNEP